MSNEWSKFLFQGYLDQLRHTGKCEVNLPHDDFEAMKKYVKETELKTFRVQMFCDCGGEMKPTGMMLASCPAQYPHQCALCNKRQNYKTTYPHLEYKAVANE